jgi:signal transduction histidine kinase
MIICFISHVQDITAKKSAERKLAEQNEELYRLNAEKDKFFSIIAHDLRSPFNLIVGLSELLVQSVEVKDYDEVAKFADIINKSSMQAMNLLMNLMEWSHSQTGRMKFNPEHFEMVGLIEQTELLFSEMARQKSITITNKTDENIPAFADKPMISTVLRNLISNSIKFTPPGGKIIISATTIQNELTISVCDNGIGISGQRMETLFRLDESYSTTGTAQETGSGLGLILCKEFVNKHEGKIWVNSEIGKGSCFSFSIPVAN